MKVLPIFLCGEEFRRNKQKKSCDEQDFFVTNYQSFHIVSID